ncbi:MAG: ABC transporter substrate-binding protein [Hyphomicrobiaceae bacterium]|nr:ABC transporter substrate-binding protein [Hyphomicrobiaceae bacterium]
MLKIPRRLRMPAIALAGLLSALASPAHAEVSEVRIAKGFGIGYMPLLVMEHEQLFEKHAKAAGLDSKATWLRVDGGTTQANLLIGGNLEISSGGLGPLVTIWERTKGTPSEVKGIASINSMPLYLNTINPAVKSLKDFTDNDRIALPVIRSSIQAVVLQMAAEKEFGPGEQNRLDTLTVAMAHPDGTAALLSGRTEVTAHLTAPPFTYQQLKDPKVHRIFSSYDVVGGPHTFNLIWTTVKFRNENPKTFAAFNAALREAMAKINADKKKYAQVYKEIDKSRLELGFIEEIMMLPETRYTAAPERTMKFADFLHKIGTIKQKPASWKDLFFPEAHDLEGS